MTGKFSHSEGFFRDENKALDRIQTDLDVIGWIPGVGDVADGVNGLISLYRKDYVSAGLDLISMVPFIGDVIGKGGKTVKQIIKHSDDVIDAGKQIIKHSDEISDVINKSEILIDKSKSYYRSMSNAEAEAVKKTGKLRGGRPGSTFFTDSRFRTAKRAQKRLALPQQPEVQVEFTIKNSPKLERNGTKVKPDFNQIGGGKEFMTNDIVDVEIINVQPY